jgi:carboxypeptidase T
VSNRSRRWNALSGLWLVLVLSATSVAPAFAANGNFPPADSLYHSYPEMVSHIHDVAAAHPDIVKLSSIGDSYEGRKLWVAKVSDHVAVDESEPEVLFDGLHHAGEYMSAEMTIAILDLLASNYGGGDRLGHRVTKLVNSREIWIVFIVNPDGLQHTLDGDPYFPWRKNRQPTPGSSWIGTDLNRNYSFRWGCCGGSSSDPASADFRGPFAFSAPETQAMRDFIHSRVVHGRQQIRVSITYHIPGRFVLWPYGYTSKAIPPTMTSLDHATYVALGTAMAERNGYRPLQWGSARRTSGSAIDWQYGTQRIFSFLVELGTSDDIPDEQIAPETARNRDAVLYLIKMAHCPYVAIGKGAQLCGAYFDDLEIDRGWTTDPDGTDTSTNGAWARGIPKADPLQLDTASSGQSVLATGLAAGHDVDGGTTTVRSPVIHLPGDATSLHLRYWVGLGSDATAGDSFVIRLVTADGALLKRPLTVNGDGTAHAPLWQTLNYPIPLELAGQDIRIELRATDGNADSGVEAGVDQVRIGAPWPLGGDISR